MWLVFFGVSDPILRKHSRLDSKDTAEGPPHFNQVDHDDWFGETREAAGWMFYSLLVREEREQDDTNVLKYAQSYLERITICVCNLQNIFSYNVLSS